jgi:hypothetical protein
MNPLNLSVTSNPSPMAHPASDASLKVTQQDASLQTTQDLTNLDQIHPDFPDSNTKEGNTLRCLEKALTEAHPSKTGEEALQDMSTRVTAVRGKFLKDGPRADSPIVADTHKDSEGREYFKFLITWEMDVNMPDGSKTTISKTQWVITGVEFPAERNLDDIHLAKHCALLAIKCHRGIHKAAFCPQSKDYSKVQNCLDYIRNQDLVGYSGYIEKGSMAFHTNPPNPKFDPGPSTIHQGQQALRSVVKLKDATGRKVKITMDASKTAQKVNNEGVKWMKTTPNDPQATPTFQKRYDQAAKMSIRNPGLAAFMKIQNAKPGELQAAIDSTIVKGDNRGYTKAGKVLELYRATKSEHKNLQSDFDLKEKQLRASVMGKYAESFNGVTGMLKMLGVTIARVFAEDKVMGMIIDNLVKDGLDKTFQDNLESSLDELSKLRSDIIESDKSLAILKYNLTIEGIHANPYASEEDKKFPLAVAKLELDHKQTALEKRPSPKLDKKIGLYDPLKPS